MCSQKLNAFISKDGIAKIIAKWNPFCLFVRINTVASQDGANDVKQKTLPPSLRSLANFAAGKR